MYNIIDVLPKTSSKLGYDLLSPVRGEDMLLSMVKHQNAILVALNFGAELKSVFFDAIVYLNIFCLHSRQCRDISVLNCLR